MGIKKLLAIAVFFIATNCSVFAAQEGDTVVDVQIKGNFSVNSSVILAQLQTQPGDMFLREVLNDDLRRLYGMGYFTDISVQVEDVEGGALIIFEVEEKFAIGSVDIDGYKLFRRTVLLKEFGIGEGEVYNKRLVQDGIKRMIKLYEEKGYYNVRIEPLVASDPLTRQVHLTLSVNENSRVLIKNITFVGNHNISDKLLKKQMKVREKWLFGGGKFRDEELDADIEKLSAYYRSKGYMMVKVGSPSITYSDNDRFMNIEIPIEEGTLYRVGIVEVKGNQLFPLAEIEESLNMDEGKVFSQVGLLMDQKNIQNYYADRGYIFAMIKPKTFINNDEGLVDVTYDIVENDLAYVERIIIQGNTRTQDKVIRRNLSVHPLEPFDGQKLKRSQEKLYNLNYFEDVQFDTAPGTKDNMRDLVVNVKEKKTGEFSFGGGYSSLDKLVGFVEISQNNFDLFNFPNFVGAGQRLSLRAELGGIRKNYNLGFTEPWLFDYPLSFGFNIFSREWERSGYDEQRTGGSIRFGHPIGEYNHGAITFKQETVDIQINDPSTLPSTILNAAGEDELRSVTFTLSRDTVDSNQLPTKGSRHSVSVEPVGGVLGGDVDIIKYTASTEWFKQVGVEKGVFQTKLRGGTIDSYKDTDLVPFYERFFAGGASTIRGYEDRHVGPFESLDPIGGSSMFIANAEYSFPLFDPIRGAVFADAGNVWLGGNDWDLGELKKGVGFGVRIKTPLGPVKLDYGFALDSNDFEDDSRLHFSMGGFF